MGPVDGFNVRVNNVVVFGFRLGFDRELFSISVFATIAADATYPQSEQTYPHNMANIPASSTLASVTALQPFGIMEKAHCPARGRSRHPA
jgi:hypothetical protein